MIRLLPIMSKQAFELEQASAAGQQGCPWVVAIALARGIPCGTFVATERCSWEGKEGSIRTTMVRGRSYVLSSRPFMTVLTIQGYQSIICRVQKRRTFLVRLPFVPKSCIRYRTKYIVTNSIPGTGYWV